MANTFQNPLWYLKEIGRGYENSLRFLANVKKQFGQDPLFSVMGAKIGNTVNYRLPPLYLVSDGAALDAQNIQNRSVAITLTNQKHVDMTVSTWEETTELDTAERETKAAGDALASVIDNLAFAAVFRDIYNFSGTLGTTPTAVATYATAGRMLTDLGVPRGRRMAVLDPEAASQIAQTVQTFFHPGPVQDRNYTDGYLGGKQLGIDEWYEDQNRPLFTSGVATGASTPLVNGAAQTGANMITDGWSGLTYVKGDTITLGGVFSVNPLSKVSTGRLQRFALTAGGTDTAGDATLPITPSIVTSGAYQNVSVSPANNAVVTYWSMAAGGTLAATNHPTGMVFDAASAFGFVTAPLAKPNGGANVERISSPARGVSLRMAQQWSALTDQNITRIDAIVGAATLDASRAVRV